jgi:acetyl esterase/lipase
VPLIPAYDAKMRAYTKAADMPMLLVDYRVTPEHPDPIPVENCYVGLRWLGDNAAELGVDPSRIGGDG